MKQIFTSSFGKKTHFLTAICFLFITSAALAQVTATEEFETESGASSFSESSINFNHTFNLANIPGFGYNGSAKFLELAQPAANSTTTATISINNSLNPGASFKINSFAGYISSSQTGSTPFNGAVTVSGTPVGTGSPVSATIVIFSASGVLPPGQTRDVNGIVNGLNFAGTPLDGLFFTSLTFSINDADGPGAGLGSRYFELDHINFSTPAIVTTQFSINDVSLSEGNSGSKLFTFTVTRSANTAASSVQVQSADNTAIAPGDYIAFPLTTLSFTAGGPLTQTVSATVNGDVTVEGNETFFMNLGNPTGGTIADAQGIGTILEDDEIAETFEDETVNTRVFAQSGFNFSSTGALLISRGLNVGTGSGITSALDTRVGDGGSTGNVGSFSITNAGTSFFITNIDAWTSNNDGLSGTTSPVAVTFTGTKADGSGTVSHVATLAAISGNNFQTVSFAGTPLANVQLISVSVTLGAGANYISLDNFRYGTAPVSGTQVSINDVSVLEGTGGGTTTATFTISRTNNISAFLVNLASSNGTATAGSDYTAFPSTTLTFTNGGALTQTVNVTILRDAAIEQNETFNMTLSGATNGTLYLKPVGIGTILDDDKVIETFEGETDDATTFSENSITFSATNRFKVNISFNSGSGSSQGYLSSSPSGTSPNTGGSQGKISITSPHTAFKLLQLDAWTATGTTPTFVTGPVTFTGTLFGGGTVTTTKTITPTNNTGTGWQQNITFTGTPLENALLTELEFIAGGAVTTIEIDNINYVAVATLPYIEVTDALNVPIINGGAASATNNTDFGTACAAISPVSKTFTIKNTGGANLTLTGTPRAVLGGADASQFSVTAQPAAVVAANSSTTFTVSYTPTAAGIHNATVTLTHNDATNNPYIINIRGTANSVVSIGAQPASVAPCAGATTTLTVTPSGTAPFTYQWRRGTTNLSNGPTGNGSTIAGATAQTLTITTVSVSDAATNYNVVITNGCGQITSGNATIGVNTGPVINDAGHPASVALCQGFPATFTVSASGTPSPTYQWRKGTTNLTNGATGTGSTIAGATAATLTISNTTPADNAADYNVIVTNVCSAVTSSNALLTVNVPPATPTVTVTPPSCSTAASITVNTPVGAGLTYSINSTDYQSATTFNNVAPGSYSVTAKNGAGCASSSFPVTINMVPAAPATPTVTVTQPTCTTAASITVNTPTDASLTYSINGIDYQASTTFNNVAPGSYSVTAKNGSSCASSPFTVTINAAPADNTPPTIISKNIIANLDASGHVTIQPGDVIQSVDDNCAINNSSLQVSPSTFSCADLTTSNSFTSHLAYAAGTSTGTQSFGGELGMEFTVNDPAGIIIKQLGVFDHLADGITGTTIRVALFNKGTNTIVPGLDVTITGFADELAGNHRMKNIPDVTLMPGTYLIVAKGFNATNRNGNFGEGSPIITGDDGGGAISYTGFSAYGSTDPATFTYPANADRGPSNRYQAGTFKYEIVSATSTSHIAYKATTSTGAQAFGGELGMEFSVNDPNGIVIKQLGAFDDQGNGITGSGIRVAIFNKATQTIVPGLNAVITGVTDDYSFNHRMKNIPPVTLMPGIYAVVAKGYNAGERNGNFGEGSPVISGDNGNGAITYTGTSSYGSTDPATFTYPLQPDQGPSNRYLAGTFSYETTFSNASSHLAYASSTSTGSQAFGGELGMEFTVNNPAGIIVKQLGAFDDQGDGITGGGIRVAIFNKTTHAIVPGLNAVVSGLADAYTSNHRLKNIPQVTLMPGSYAVVAKGYNAGERNGNFGLGSPIIAGDNGGGAITYTGTSAYGNTDPATFTYPSNIDGGPANRYIAGTFSFDLPSSNGKTVAITVKDASGNTGTATAIVTVQDPTGACNPSVANSGFSSMVADQKTSLIRLFPNPTNGVFSMELRDLKAAKTTVQILNENGKLVEQKDISGSRKTGSAIVNFNLVNKPAGMYFAKVMSAGGVEILKVIVQH